MPLRERNSGPRAVAAAGSLTGPAANGASRLPLLEFAVTGLLLLLFVPALLVTARQQVSNERSMARLAIASDPSGAAVIIDDVVVGRTPVVVELERGGEVSLRVEAEEPYLEYDLYKPYRTTLAVEADRNLGVWIPRTTAEEQAEQRARLAGAASR